MLFYANYTILATQRGAWPNAPPKYAPGLKRTFKLHDFSWMRFRPWTDEAPLLKTHSHRTEKLRLLKLFATFAKNSSYIKC